MTTTFDNPYAVLGVKDNADIHEVTEAYKKLAKKYHPDLNPDDVIAAEAMKTINSAYEAIKNGFTTSSELDNTVAHSNKENADTYENQTQDQYNSSKRNEKTFDRNSQKKERVVKEEKYINITKTSRIVLNMLYSLFLSAAVLCALFALNNFLHTNESILSYYSEGISIYSFLNELVLEIVNYERISNILPLMFKNFNADTFVTLSTVFIFASIIMFTVTLILTVLYNALYLICIKAMDKCNNIFKNHLTESDVLRSYILHKRLKKTIHISNIVYAIFTYISLFITELSVIMITIMSGVGLTCVILSDTDKFSTLSIISKIFIIIGFVILFFAGSALLIKKKERIVASGKYVCYENLGTYFKGIATVLIPVLSVIAIAVTVLIFFIKFLLWLFGRPAD